MVAASVIVSTYERPENLVRCLEGFRFQTATDFEIVVADDGSGPATAEAIREAAKDHPRPIRHVWHEDRGFRKCMILNRALREASSDYLVFTDSDCVPHRRFVEMHLRYRAPGRFLVGRMVKWGAERSRAVDRAAIAQGAHARIRLRDWIDNYRGKHRNLPYGFYLPGDWGFRLVQHLKKNKNARGCNFSAWKADLERVNGWNEDFESWGLEDVELGFRLRLAGVEPKLVINKACTFHLFHPRIDRTKSRSARIAWDASKARRQPWCPNGLTRSDAPPPPGHTRSDAAPPPTPA